MVAEFCLLIGYIPCSLMRIETAARYPSGSDTLVRSAHYRSTSCIIRCRNAVLAILVKNELNEVYKSVASYVYNVT